MLLLDFHCVVCTRPIPEERARRKAKFCSSACRFEAERRIKAIRTTSYRKVKRTPDGATPRVEQALRNEV